MIFVNGIACCTLFHQETSCPYTIGMPFYYCPGFLTRGLFMSGIITDRKKDERVFLTTNIRPGSR
jgi:hypothetical protein